MLTTLEVRAIMKKHITVSFYNPIYTNKLKDSNLRSVKCYMPRNADALITELRQKAGDLNVIVTEGAKHSYALGPGITVRCLLA